MKFRSISLNEDNSKNLDTYGLVKYTDERFKEYEKLYLDELEKLDKNLVGRVKLYPKVFREDGHKQCYMIVKNCYKCVGIVETGLTKIGKDLGVQIQLNEEYLSSEQMNNLIEQLVESLKLFFFDMENIEIWLHNDIDLSKINEYKYHKKVLESGLPIYICSNKKNNILIPKLVKEMNETEKCLTDWGQSWQQEIRETELNSDFDNQFIDEINKGIVTLPEIFYKVKTIYWTGIKSAKSTRNISFSRDGNINFIKKTGYYKEGIDYEFSYNILRDGFNMKHPKRKGAGFLTIDENMYYTNIKTRQLNILESKENHRKRINYTSPVIDNSSVVIELWENDDNEIENCYVDFRTHKNNFSAYKSNGKINGMYALRIIPEYDRFSIKFISRKGNRYYDFGNEVLESEEELFSTVVDGKLTIEFIDELIRKIIPIINMNATNNNRQTISDKHENIASNLIDAEKEAIDFVKQIKGEIPLPHLQKELENFVNEYKNGTMSIYVPQHHYTRKERERIKKEEAKILKLKSKK